MRKETHRRACVQVTQAAPTPAPAGTTVAAVVVKVEVRSAGREVHVSRYRECRRWGVSAFVMASEVPVGWW